MKGGKRRGGERTERLIGVAKAAQERKRSSGESFLEERNGRNPE